MSARRSATAETSPAGASDLGERGERPLVVLDGVLVGVEAAGPVARRHEVARRLAPVAAQAPVAREGLDVLETRRTPADHALQRLARPRVKLDPAAEQEALVRDLLEERVREPVAAIPRRARHGVRPPAPPRPPGSRPPRSCSSAASRPAGSLATSRRRAASNTGPRTAASWRACRVPSGRRSTLASRSPWMVGGTSARGGPGGARPPGLPADEDARGDQAAEDLLEKQGLAARPDRGRADGGAAACPRSTRRGRPPARPRSRAATAASGGAPCGPLGSWRGPGPRSPAGRSRPASGAGRRADRPPPGGAPPRPRRPSGGSPRSARAGPAGAGARSGGASRGRSGA